MYAIRSYYVLFVLDSTNNITEEEKELINKINTEKIIVLNKQDISDKEYNLNYENIVKINTIEA